MVISLVFEHALRIRLKAETTSNGSSAAAPESADPEPVSAAVAAAAPGIGEVETAVKEGGQAGADEVTLHSRAETAVSASGSASASAAPSEAGHASEASAATLVGTAKDDKKGKKDEEKKDKKDDKKKGNLVGRINNLVTSDLQNITESRDFLFLVLSAPLNIVFGVVFLYAILGWRCAKDTTLTGLLC
jgi:hypothetical protein